MPSANKKRKGQRLRAEWTMQVDMDVLIEECKPWLLLFPLHLALLVFFRTFGLMNRLTAKGSLLSDIMVFEILASFCVLYLSWYGLVGWFHWYDEDDSFLAPDSWYLESKFLRKHIAVPMMMYQVRQDALQ